jgi:pimeloyl-ACP methyl ester carboxylesterase
MSEVRYAGNGRVRIAHQVVGDGPVDLVVAPGFASHLDAMWEEPLLAAFLDRLAAGSRLILFDAREQGLSDRLGRAPTLEDNVGDLAAVLDATASERAVVLGVSQGGPMAIAFAAAHPGRTLGLILYGAYAKAARADDYPIGVTQEVLGRFAEIAADQWGTDALLPLFAPTAAGDEAFARWWRRSSRAALSPAGVRTMLARRAALDVRDRLGAIRAPTLVVHRTGDRVNPVGHVRHLAAAIPGAELRELPGEDHLWWLPDPAQVARPVLDFVARTARRARRRPAGAAPRPPAAATASA